jgi:hypothetical protein
MKRLGSRESPALQMVMYPRTTSTTTTIAIRTIQPIIGWTLPTRGHRALCALDLGPGPAR